MGTPGFWAPEVHQRPRGSNGRVGELPEGPWGQLFE